jgi:hypothetical protein
MKGESVDLKIKINNFMDTIFMPCLLKKMLKTVYDFECY